MTFESRNPWLSLEAMPVANQLEGKALETPAAMLDPVGGNFMIRTGLTSRARRIL